MHADILIQSNKIFTATEQPVFAGYLAVKEGRIAAVGPGEPPVELTGPETQVIDLGDKTLCPGFTDVHCFFMGWALGSIGADLSAAADLAQLLELAKTHAATLPDDAPVLGHGWDDNALHPQDSDLLDQAFGVRPTVLMASSGETCWMNKAAIQRYGFDSSSCYLEAMWRLLREMMSQRDYILPKFREYMAMMNSKGITSIKEMAFDDSYGFADLLEELAQLDQLTLRVSFMSQPVGAGINIPFGQEMRDRFAGDYLRFSGYNRMTDGSVSQHCADLKQPYSDQNTCCAQEIDWQLIAQETQAADREGFRFSLHAQGDGAIAKVLDIYEGCQRGSDGRLINRHSITDLEFSDPADLERMGHLGAIAEIYPQIQSIASRYDKLAMIRQMIGEQRSRYYWNRREMADSGVLISCGTDLPLLIDDIPQSIYHATGCLFPEGGQPFNPQNALTRQEVLSAWCSGGAYNLYCERNLGTLEPGKLADIAVLSGDIFSASMDQIREIQVCLTLIGGKVVFTTL